MGVPLILGAVGAVVSAAGAIGAGNAAANQARAQQSAANFNAAVASQNAHLARQQAAVDATEKEREGERRLGAVRAAAGASGLTQDYAGDILADVASSNELDVLLTRHRGEVAGTGFQNTATLDRARADSFGAQVGPLRTAGYLSAAGTLLKGGVDIYDRLKQK